MTGHWRSLLLLFLALGCGDKSKPSGAGDDAGAESKTKPAIAAAVLPKTEAVPEHWWKEAQTHCPKGTELKGKAPPDGRSVWCADKNYKRTGPRTNWHANGSKASEGWEVDSDRAGPWTHWHDNGQVERRITYVPTSGHTGLYEQFDSTGKKLGEYELKDGTGKGMFWHPNGTVSESGPMEGGRRHGTWTEFTREGKKRREVPWVHGKRDGKSTVWKDSVRISEEFHKAGKPEGRRTRFDPKTGEPVQASVYRDGKKLYEVFYQDGKVLGQEPRTGCFSDKETSNALRAAGKEPLPARRACVQRPRAFPALTIIGSFAHDRGCAVRERLWHCKLAETIPAKQVLKEAGWLEANLENRKAMAMRYLRQVNLAYAGTIASEPEKPSTTTSDDGSITIVAWVNRPSGMQRGRTADRNEYVFSPKGTLKARTLETKRFER